MLKKLPLEERWNIYTHGFGAIISSICVIYFIAFSNLSLYENNLGPNPILKVLAPMPHKRPTK